MEKLTLTYRRLIYGAFAVSLLLLLGIAYLSSRALRENEENLHLVLLTHEVLTEGERLYSELKDANRSQRGYLLTENQVYLTKFADSKEAVNAHLQQLKGLTADQVYQQEKLAEISTLIDEAFAYWEKTIFLYQNQNREAALSLVREGIGLRFAEKTGTLIGEFVQFEQMLLAQRQAEYLSSKNHKNLLEIAGGILAILLFCLAFFMLHKLLEKERKFSASLEERVAQRTNELNKTLESLNRANEELDNFVYTASHDLQAPVANLLGLQKALQKSFHSNIPPKQDQIINLMGASIERLHRTIKGLADSARITREDQPTENIPFATVLQDVLIDIDPLIEKTNAQVIFDFQVAQIKYPYAHLKSVLYNLVSNAIKYHSPERIPIVSISTFQEQGRTCLRVKDNGLGLDPRQLSKLFIMYNRLHHHVAGSGVGLSMVKRIIENKSGQILVSSSFGEGSSFTVVF